MRRAAKCPLGIRPRVATAVMVGEGHAPLWQYFAGMEKKPDERIFAPKGHGPPHPLWVLA
jgi:hypothetical protein